MKRKGMNKWIAVLCAAGLVLSLAGCQGAQTPETVPAASVAEAAAETKESGTKAAETPAATDPETQPEPVLTEAKKGEGSGKTDHVIVLSSMENSDGSWSHTAALDGTEVKEYDYTWNCDIGTDHDEVKNCPAEYYTGTEPGEDAGAVYIAHDIYYYPELPADSFKLVNYDGEQEWAVYYPETSEYKDYIFATLPSGRTIGGNNQASVPTDMMHSAKEAAGNAKLHITEPGSYSIEGTWHGQIWIDLGDQDDTFADENAKVTLYLNGADVTCSVAPALVFYSCYECDNQWEEQETWTKDVDTSAAGANVVLADGSVNNFTGTNIFRMLKTKKKNDDDTSEVPVQKKARKTDAAFYSYRSMNISGDKEGTGILNVNSGFEGLDSELHLTVNSGNVNIYSKDDGINCNEDGVSVVTVNGGSVHILAGLGTEGDGVDSNGFLVINGGTVVAMANPASDSGLDSDFGSYVNGGTVVALGSTMDWAEADDSNTARSATMNLRFATRQSADEAIIVTDTEGKVVFAYDPDKDEIASGNARTYQGAVVSCENFEIGKEYKVYVGGDVTGTETAGVYDASTVTGFSSEAVQQGYSGQDGFGGFGGPGGFGGFDGQTPPEMPKDGERPSMPEGQDGGKGGERPSMPEGQGFGQGGGRPSMPEGQGFGQGGERPSFAEGERPSDFDPNSLPEGFDPSKIPDGGFGGEGQTVAASELTILFKIEDSVNNFSGVQDYLP